MRTVTIEHTYYTVRELKEQGGNGFVRALDEYAQQECAWQDWSDEWASLRALDDAVGYRRERYWHWDHNGLGAVADMTGRRAFAWLENVVLGPLRQPWAPIAQRSRYRKPGHVPDCPFTGFYMDDVVLDDLRDSLRSGMSVGDAMLTLEAKVQRVIDEELDYRTSEDAFIERAEDEGWEFTEAGERA